jgi:uncharacterized membrane protein YraQ (UPF0718 family)
VEAFLHELSILLSDILEEAWSIFWYFVAGVAMEALVRTYGWHIHLRRLLERRTHGAILLAVGIGMFSPLCACGILPLTISMLLSGVPLAPAMALLVSSPLMSPAGFTTTVNNLGMDWALAKLVAAVLMGLLAGYVTLFLQKRGAFAGGLFSRAIPMGDFHDPDYACEDLKCSCRKQFSKRFVDGKTKNRFLIFLGKFVDGFLKIGALVLLGVVIEILSIRYLPLEWVQPLLAGASPLAIPIIVLVSVPLHINQITASFILSGYLDLPLARGPGLAFLIGGPATALPVMGVFLAYFRKRIFLLYLGVCTLGTIGLAYAYQYLWP